MKEFKVLMLACAFMLFSGCVSTAMEGANIAKDESIRSKNISAANAGDVEAQYKVESR
jgi:hypothetical protein